MLQIVTQKYYKAAFDINVKSGFRAVGIDFMQVLCYN